MRRTLIAATCMLVLALAGQANAKIIAGQYVPDDLNTGDHYRLLFVTNGSFAGTSSASSVYDGYIKSEADRAGSLVGGISGWEAIVSTSAASARSRAVGDGTPVYGLNAAGGDPTDLLAGDYESLFTGAGPGVRGYDQFGQSMGNSIMWSGSNDDGTFTGTFTENPLGPGSPPIPYYPAWGTAGTTYTQWLDFHDSLLNLFPNSTQLRLYGISPVLTVPVPEPATIMMWSLFAGVAGLVFWRKGRKSS